VHDGGERVLGRDRPEDGFELRPVRHVAGGDGDGRAERGQLVVESGRFTAAAD
jgi:hypothetical protein